MVENQKKEMPVLFTKDNYKWMLIGIIILVLGMVLMAGGRSDTGANVFDFKDVYSTRRITIAPIVILLGLAIEIFAIFKKPKKVTTE